jgi:hypothetical protein
MVLGATAAIEPLVPVLAVPVHVTVITDNLFISMTLNLAVFQHVVGDQPSRPQGWHAPCLYLVTPLPVLEMWFPETCPVPIPMPFNKLEHVVRRFERTVVKECFLTFSVVSVK